MTDLTSWAAGAAMLFGLVLLDPSVASAETRISQSNAANAELGTSLTALLSQEHAALGAMDGAAMVTLAAGRTVEGPDKAADDAAAGTATVLRRRNAEGAPATGDLTQAVLASVAMPNAGAEFTCLATAMYHEARGETIRGQAAVGEVILNRVDSGEYPRSICGVVNQRGNGGCQFSYVCDRRTDAITDRGSWLRAERIAAVLMAGATRTLTGGATHFHTPKVRPDWSRRFARTAVIGGHIFYRQPIRTAMN